MVKIYLELGHFTLRDDQGFDFHTAFQKTSGKWLRHYTFSGFFWVFKTSYHLLIFPPPTNLPNSLPLFSQHATGKGITLERNPHKNAR